MKSPKAQPKTKPRPKRPPIARAKSTRVTNLGGSTSAYIRLPALPKPIGEYPSINHPRGKDGAWGR